MLATVMLVIAFLTFLAALGRGATPKSERLPVRAWGVADLIGNVVLGARRLAELHERDPRTPPLDDLGASRRHLARPEPQDPHW